MRIDKYLWSIRVFKTRSLATQACKLNKVKVNGKVVKASRELVVGQKIDVKKNNIEYSYKILDFPKSRVGAKLVADYSLEVTSAAEIEKLEMLRLQHAGQRDRGLGRPTKKDRRDIQEFAEEWDWDDWEEEDD